MYPHSHLIDRTDPSGCNLLPWPWPVSSLCLFSSEIWKRWKMKNPQTTRLEDSSCQNNLRGIIYVFKWKDQEFSRKFSCHEFYKTPIFGRWGKIESKKKSCFSLFWKTHLSILPNGLFLSNIKLPFIQNCTEIWPSWCVLGYSVVGNFVKMWRGQRDPPLSSPRGSGVMKIFWIEMNILQRTGTLHYQVLTGKNNLEMEMSLPGIIITFEIIWFMLDWIVVLNRIFYQQVSI